MPGGKKQVSATNILSHPSEETHSLATKLIARVYPLGKARMRHAELGAAALIVVAEKGHMSDLHDNYGVSAFARPSLAQSLQDCESLWVKFGNCAPGGGETREGLPPEDGSSQQAGKQSRQTLS